jgi:hypothetical protein
MIFRGTNYFHYHVKFLKNIYYLCWIIYNYYKIKNLQVFFIVGFGLKSSLNSYLFQTWKKFEIMFTLKSILALLILKYLK